MKKILHINPVTAILLLLTMTTAQPGHADPKDEVERIKINEGQIVSEITGQAISSPTGGTLFGYYTFIKGIDMLFAHAPEDETAALFTFFRDTTNVRVSFNGPLLILSREGTNSVYLNAAPAGDFSNPDSFRTGTAIQSATLRFQAVIDTITQTAAVVIEDTITATSVFSLNGHKYQIGQVGDVIRTTQHVHLNSAGALPSAGFGGYSVGALKVDNSQ